MSKRLHLICNAHIDPVWQWEWEEGAAETLSTFRIAAEFCEEYGNFVFCHNEALLYQWIEEYAPQLFERIRTLVKKGNWHIMGGWHLQPDCNIPSGEGFVRQILSGRKYFLEKFGRVPTVACNFDPFGHSRGLVQIIRKSGYDGYLFMRPQKHVTEFTPPGNEFRWVGYDGSEVTAIRFQDGYASQKGKSAEKIRQFINDCPEDDFHICLWGVGNHGGGPSRKDLEDITELQQEVSAAGVELIHSTPEEYFAEVAKNRTLPAFEKSLNPWGVGCYTSQVLVKQKYRYVENLLFLTETMCSHAALSGEFEYPSADFAEAIYDILTVQFHDTLPGTSVESAEKMSIRMLDHAAEILTRLKARAFFALASGQKKADSDRIPLFAYNPYPYPISGDFECEFSLWDQNWNPEFLSPIVHNEKGEPLPSQCEKENSTIPIDWRKRVIFNTTLEPMKLSRFDCAFASLPEKPKPAIPCQGNHLIFEADGMRITINKQTGLVDEYSLNGYNYLREGSFTLDVYQDDYDPWGMLVTCYKNKIGEFRLATPKETAEFLCVKDEFDPVHVIESGAVRTVVEAVFCYNNSRALVKYIMSKKEGLQIDVRLVWNEKQLMVKLSVPSAFGADRCIGEHPYGREELHTDLSENVSQRYIVICGSKKALSVINNGSYGSSFDGGEGKLNITLLRSPAYCAHPVDGRVTMPTDRFVPHMDQGERDFSFRISVGDEDHLLVTSPRDAQHFNMRPVLLSFYPTGTGKLPVAPLCLHSDTVCMTTFKRADVGEGYIIRLHNPTSEIRTATLNYFNHSISLSFGAYEIKTLRATESGLCLCDLMEGLLD